MAKAYRSLSNIDHGEGTDDQGRALGKFFPFGSIVTGLDRDTMKSLWDAGVLEEVEIPDSMLAEETKKNEERFGAASSEGAPAEQPAESSTPAATTVEPTPPAES